MKQKMQFLQWSMAILFCMSQWAWGQKQSIFTIGTTTSPGTPAGQQLTATANSYAVAGNTTTTYLNVIINNAITAGYRNFFIQEGTYYLGGSINLDAVTKQSVKITGSGKNTILRPAAAAPLLETMFLFQNSENNSISDLSVELSSSSTALTLKSKRAFYLKNGGQRNIFDNIYIGSSVYQTTATANTATTTNLAAIELEGKSATGALDIDYNTFSNIYFRKFDNCVRFNVETTISHNIFDNFHLEAFKIGVDFVGTTNLCSGNFFTDWDVQAKGAVVTRSTPTGPITGVSTPSYTTNIIKDIKGAHNTFRNFTVADWLPYTGFDSNGPITGAGYYMFNITADAERTVIENTDAETNNHFPNVDKSGTKAGWYLDEGVGTQFFNNANFDRITDYIGYNVNEIIYRGQNKSLLSPTTATVANVNDAKHNNLRFENFGRVRFTGNTALYNSSVSNLPPDFHITDFKRVRIGSFAEFSGNGFFGVTSTALQNTLNAMTNNELRGNVSFQTHNNMFLKETYDPSNSSDLRGKPFESSDANAKKYVITNTNGWGGFQWTKVSELLSASSWNHIASQNIKMNNFAIVNNPAVPDPANAPGIRLDNNGNVRVGTEVPLTTNTPKLQVDGNIMGESLISTNGSVPNNSVAVNFASQLERYQKSKVINAGALLDNQEAVDATARSFKFYDFPKSNFDPIPWFWFALEDRNNSNRFRVVAHNGGPGQLILSDRNQSPYFFVREDGNDNVILTMQKENSAVAIGTSTFSYPTDVTATNDGNYKLVVNGKIRGTGLKLTTAYWSDFVFAKDYQLPTLQAVEQHIIEKGHLPNIPSEKEVVEKGVDMLEMAKLQMQKIEELTLYIIEQNKKIEVLEAKVQKFEKQ